MIDSLGLAKRLADLFEPYAAGAGMVARQLVDPLPGYANESDGSVGILGKAFGSLGIDAEGRRAATRWGDAWRNSVDPDTTGRTASMLPIRGDGGYGVPTLISQPFESFDEMWARGDEANISNPNALAASSINGLDAAGGAMTGGLAAGLGGAVPEGALTANGFKGRFYRGVAGRNRDFHGPNEGPWASSSPDEAAQFAELYGDGGPPGARMYPVDVEFKNPMIVDAQGNDWADIPYNGQRLSTDDIAAMVPPGHDGIVFQNIIENDGDFGAVGPGNWVPKGTPSTSVKALQPGTVRSATTGNLLYGNAPTGSSVPLAVNAMERKGITAYHGSPHDFDKFDMSKIGTGEGAQAYGHGLYFAENEGVARSYRDQLSDYSGAVKWRGAEPPTAQQQELMALLGGPDAATGSAMTIDALSRDLGKQARMWANMEFADPAKREIESARLFALKDELARVRDNIDVKPPGHMYEVNINADPEHFLDWDKPLMDQHETVRNAMEQFRSVPGAEGLWSIRGHLRQGLPGQSAVNHLAKLLGGPEHVSAKLREAGVPGVRYLDQGSRFGGGEGTRNYAVFDDSLVNINRKYANHPVGAASPLAFTDYDEQQKKPLAQTLAGY